MAYQSTFLLALLFITTSSLAHGLIIKDTTIAQVSVLGRLTCSINGPGIGGVDVTLSCDGGRTSLAQVATDPSGFFELDLNLSGGITFNPFICRAFVRLPIANCTALPPAGTLRAVPVLLDVVQAAAGERARFGLTVFTPVP